MRSSIFLLSLGIVIGAVAFGLGVWAGTKPTQPCECDKAEYDELLFEYIGLTAENARLQYECSGVFDLQEAYEGVAEPLPYYVPVDIQEPLPYIYEPQST